MKEMRELEEREIYYYSMTRLPYYHPPRSRPVTFEDPVKPDSSDIRSVQVSKELAKAREKKLENQEQVKLQKEESKMSSKLIESPSLQSRSLTNNSSSSSIYPSYNSSPRPFVRENPPRIQVNGRATYPTSTVHKSMLSSLGPVSQPSERAAASANQSEGFYTRLITPTLLTASEEWAGQFKSDAERDDERKKLECPSREFPAALRQAAAGKGNEQASLSFSATERGWNHKLAASNKRRPVPASSSSLLPNSKRDEYMQSRQLERSSIAHQTYRTLPIVGPSPKARHDLATGNYMRLNRDPSWELSRSQAVRKDHERSIKLALASINAAPAHQRNDYTHYERTDMTRPVGQSPKEHTNAPDPSVFNYREYIESTRRAH